jgi:hypothetical protein
VSLVDLLLTGGMNMSAWRGMRIEVEGTLAPKSATGLQEIRIRVFALQSKRASGVRSSCGGNPGLAAQLRIDP